MKYLKIIYTIFSCIKKYPKPTNLYIKTFYYQIPQISMAAFADFSLIIPNILLVD